MVTSTISSKAFSGQNKGHRRGFNFNTFISSIAVKTYRESYLSFSLIGYVLFFKHTSSSFPLLLVSFIALKLMFLFQWEDKEGVECHECSLKLTQNCDRVEIWDALNLRINERINWGTRIFETIALSVAFMLLNFNHLDQKRWGAGQSWTRFRIEPS